MSYVSYLVNIHVHTYNSMQVVKSTNVNVSITIVHVIMYSYTMVSFMIANLREKILIKLDKIFIISPLN